MELLPQSVFPLVLSQSSNLILLPNPTWFCYQIPHAWLSHAAFSETVLLEAKTNVVKKKMDCRQTPGHWKLATAAELKAILKDTLGKRKVLWHLRVRIWAEVFSALADKRRPWPTLSHENLLINELIQEYLKFNMSIRVCPSGDSGQPVVQLDSFSSVN